MAEIVAATFADTLIVETVNVTEVAPAGTVTAAGTVASGEFEARVIVYPPIGAAPPRVTVPVELIPPTTLVGFNVSPVMFGTLISSETELTAPL